MPTWTNRSAVDQPFLDRAPERRAVKILAAEILVPGVDVRVELHERERTVPLRQRAQDRQRDRVVAADHDRPRARPRRSRRCAPRSPRSLLDADRRRVDVADVGDVQHVERRHLLEIAVRPDQATTARGSRAGRAARRGDTTCRRRTARRRSPRRDPRGSSTCGSRMNVAGCANRGDLNEARG